LQVDILVEDEQGQFLVFEQVNYGLAEPSLAVVSKHLEAYEDPLQAAKSELQEEMGRVADVWLPLGQYRGDANRGAGNVVCFLARRSRPGSTGGRIASNELETKKAVKLSRPDLLAALLQNRFREIKWAGTVALGLLRLQQEQSQSQPQPQPQQEQGQLQLQLAQALAPSRESQMRPSGE
jgi:hypothetical protein